MPIRKDTHEAYKRGNFICNICKEEKLIEEFGSHKNSNIYGLSSICKKCTREKDKFSKIRNIYGLSEEQYIEMFDKQKGKCKICTKSINFRGTVSDKYNSACVDHCHETGKIRGLLCSSCNRGLGFFSEDPEILHSAYKYLKEDNGKKT